MIKEVFKTLKDSTGKIMRIGGAGIYKEEIIETISIINNFLHINFNKINLIEYNTIKRLDNNIFIFRSDKRRDVIVLLIK